MADRSDTVATIRVLQQQQQDILARCVLLASLR
jgi:hypothetical protein